MLTPLPGLDEATVSTEVGEPPPTVTFALAVLPSEKFAVNVNVAPGINNPFGNVALKKSAAKALKLLPAVNGKFTVPLAALNRAVSNPLAAPNTQNPFGIVSHIPMGPLRVRLRLVTVRLPLAAPKVTVNVPSNN